MFIYDSYVLSPLQCSGSPTREIQGEVWGSPSQLDDANLCAQSRSRVTVSANWTLDIYMYLGNQFPLSDDDTVSERRSDL